jgi:hypothetical protein
MDILMKTNSLIYVGLMLAIFLALATANKVVEGFGEDSDGAIFWGGTPGGGPTPDGSVKFEKGCKLPPMTTPAEVEAAVKAGKISKSWVKDGKVQKNKDPSCKGDDCEMLPGWAEDGSCGFSGTDPEGAKTAALKLCGKTKGCVGINWFDASGFDQALDPKSSVPKNKLYSFIMASDTPMECQYGRDKNLKEWQQYCKDFSKSKIGPAFTQARKFSELDQYLGPIPVFGEPGASAPSLCEKGACESCPPTISKTPQTGPKVEPCWEHGGMLLEMSMFENTKKGEADKIFKKAGKYMGSFPRDGGGITGGAAGGIGSIGSKLMKDVTSFGKDLGKVF